MHFVFGANTFQKQQNKRSKLKEMPQIAGAPLPSLSFFFLLLLLLKCAQHPALDLEHSQSLKNETPPPAFSLPPKGQYYHTCAVRVWKQSYPLTSI